MLSSQLLRYMAFATLIVRGYTKETNARGFLDSLVEKHRNTVKKELEELRYAPGEDAQVLSSFANLKGDSLNPQVGPTPVSYTHLDVYKRQNMLPANT